VYRLSSLLDVAFEASPHRLQRALDFSLSEWVFKRNQIEIVEKDIRCAVV